MPTVYWLKNRDNLFYFIYFCVNVGLNCQHNNQDGLFELVDAQTNQVQFV